MSIILLHAGELDEPRSLQECLREMHDDERARRLAEIDRRTFNGSLHNEPSGPIVDPGPYVPNPALDGISIRVRVLDARRADILNAQHAKALKRYLKADEQPEDVRDDVVVAEAKGAVFDARRTYVAETIAGIEGVEGVQIASGGALSDGTLDALERAFLINPLYSAARFIQGLDAKKAARCGRSPVSTSASSIAVPAHSIATQPVVAMEAVGTSTGAPQSSPAASTQPTPVLGGT